LWSAQALGPASHDPKPLTGGGSEKAQWGEVVKNGT